MQGEARHTHRHIGIRPRHDRYTRLTECVEQDVLRFGIGLPIDPAAGLAIIIPLVRPAIDVHLRHPPHPARGNHRAFGNAGVLVGELRGIEFRVQVQLLALETVNQFHRGGHGDAVFDHAACHLVAPLPDIFEERLRLIRPVSAKFPVQSLHELFNMRHFALVRRPEVIQTDGNRQMPDQFDALRAGRLAHRLIAGLVEKAARLQRVISLGREILHGIVHLVFGTNDGFALGPADKGALHRSEGRKLRRDSEDVRPDPAVFNLRPPAQIDRHRVHVAHLCHAIGDIYQKVILALPEMDMGIRQAGDQIAPLPVDRLQPRRHGICGHDRPDQACIHHDRLPRHEGIPLRRQHVHIHQRIGIRPRWRQVRLGHFDKGPIHPVQLAIDEDIGRHHAHESNRAERQTNSNNPFQHHRPIYLVTV